MDTLFYPKPESVQINTSSQQYLLITTDGGIPRARLVSASVEGLHILLGKLKVKNLRVLFDPRLGHRLGQRYEPLARRVSKTTPKPRDRHHALTICKLHLIRI